MKDEKYDQLEPSLVYLLDNDAHRLSLKKMNEYIMVSSVLKRLGFHSEYPFREIFRPEKEGLMEKLSVLVEANRFHERIEK